MEQLDKKFIQFLTKQVNNNKYNIYFIKYIGPSHTRNIRKFNTFFNQKKKKKELPRNTYGIFEPFKFI
jgi:hypothetical protein